MTGFIDWIDGKLSLYVFDKKGARYLHSDTVSVPFEGELNQSLLSSIAKNNIDRICLSIPLNLLSLRELTFPFKDNKKIKDTLPYELEGILLGNTSDYSFDHFIMESPENSSKVLAVCIEKIKLKTIIELFSSAGLEPACITSLDLRLSGNDIEKIIERPLFDEKTRIETAGEELLNPTVNLRQGELSYKGDIEQLKKSLRITGVLVLFLLLIAGSYAALKFISLKNENASLSQKINTLYRDAFPEDNKIIDAARQFKGNLIALRTKKDILRGMPVLEMLLSISNSVSKDITLNEFNTDKENILIKGTALSFENVDTLKNALSSSFADVRIVDSKSLLDNKINFSIIMKEKTL